MPVGPVRDRVLHERPSGLPATLADLTAPCYVHRAPQWMVTLTLGSMALVLITALVAAGVRGSAVGLTKGQGLFAACLVLGLLPLLNRRRWLAPIVLAADRHGVFFVGSREHVVVRWEDIGPITVERARVQGGAMMCAILPIATQSSFWDAARQSAFHSFLLGDEHPPSYWRYPIAPQGIPPRETAASLEALRPAARS